MKRRNFDSAKLRRTLKKNRMSEGFCSSGLIYLKILFVWAFVMMVDFLLDFRFEYFWPSWLLLRSIYDSFRYQGVAFSVFFVCVTVTSDMICFIFIPVQWLFLLAGTCVWVQYVWHADRGICLPTVTLWLLFIYVEASVRLKELKTLPFTLDICRPFAAHCIGYPVVTLGFGVKTYVSYRLRWRKQREVAKENEIYTQLLREALPAEQHHRVTDGSFEQDQPKYLTGVLTSSVSTGEDVISNGGLARCSSVSSALFNASASYSTALHQQRPLSTANGAVVASSTAASGNGAAASNGFSLGCLSFFGARSSPAAGVAGGANARSQYTATAANTLALDKNGSAGSNSAFLNSLYLAKGSSAYIHRQKYDTDNGGPSTLVQRRSNGLLYQEKNDDTYTNTPDVTSYFSRLLSFIGRWLFFSAAPLSLAPAIDDDSRRRTTTRRRISRATAVGGGDYGMVDDEPSMSRAADYVSSLSWPPANAVGDSDDDGSGASAEQTHDASGFASEGLRRRQVSTCGANVGSGKGRRRAHITAAAQSTLAVAVAAECSTMTSTVTTASKDSTVAAAGGQPPSKVQDKDLLYSHLESDLEKVRNEVRLNKIREQELRRQIGELTNSEKSMKLELQSVKQQHEQLQTKFQNLMKVRQQDRDNVSTLEKRVCEEQKLKNQLELMLKQEKKQQQKKLEEAVANLVITKAANAKPDCTEICKQRRRDLENQLKQVRRDAQQREDQLCQLEQEILALRQYKEANNVEAMVSALTAVQEKNQHLEMSLSAETRIKLDLFSALGDAKRQLEIITAQHSRKEHELDEMRRRFGQMNSAPNNVMMYNNGGAPSCRGGSVGQVVTNQQLTPPTSVTPATTGGVMDQSSFDVLSQQMYAAPYNMSSINGLMFDECGMNYANLPFVPMANSGPGDHQQQHQPISLNHMRYSPPRSSTSK